MKTLFLLLLLFLSGCAADTPSPFVGTPRRRTLEVAHTDATKDTEASPIAFSVLFPQAGATALALHEPAEGAYLGAWLSPDISHITLRSFGNLAEKPHALFAYEMVLGEEIPITWILHAMAADAAPLFYLRPKEYTFAGGFPVNELIDLARALGGYNIPMFLAFFPLESGHDMTPEVYVNLFRLARILFRTYAPQVAFVWLPPEGQTDATPLHPFYPGHDVVDWVGVPALALREPEGLGESILSAIAPFHQSFQRHKPIMLLPVGVSHFSRVDYTYRISEAAQELKRVYAGLAGFPRVKAVVYRDAFRVGPRWDDISLTRERELMLAYAYAVGCGHFLSALCNAPHPPHAPPRRWLRSAFHGYYYDGDFFVDMETLTSELSISRPSAPTMINGQPFASVSRLSPEITTDTQRRIIFIHLPS
ncbi:MAG: hypothetical protein FWB88_02715 [Defluviitaleaceae bacterium]|nr:hypothetical protein [Defluviitaleaceae bacterium]MCL2238542.1 hypothetical protein [Defluviitaleaceae bacterium]